MSETATEPRELSLSALLEALLFIAPVPVTPGQMATVLGVSTHQIEIAISELDALYTESGDKRGLRIRLHRGRIQLTTAPQASATIEKFLGLDSTTRLSHAALEALAIIAYQEPVTRPQIDAIRGVNSDGVLKNLLSKGLIQEVGRADAPGRPFLYSITTDFLGHFGLSSLDELPPLEKSPEEIEDIDHPSDHSSQIPSTPVSSNGY
ncbi:MAG: SMC-Scp complex subunit ScpB [Anaerolineales bacterium]|nr:SMC-Scp complex subunit ScpB [Anaerolineales bacterium]MCK4975440.1 SMC-Scp complex subunit ScpB [Anaerolineales bacterium]